MLFNVKLINKDTFEMVNTDITISDDLSFRKFRAALDKEVQRAIKRLLNEENLRRLHEQKDKEDE